MLDECRNLITLRGRATESPERQTARVKGGLQKAWKTALRATVAAVCAGSLAVNALAMPREADFNTEGAGDTTAETLVNNLFEALRLTELQYFIAERVVDAFLRQRANAADRNYFPQGDQAKVLFTKILVQVAATTVLVPLYAAVQGLSYNTTSRLELARGYKRDSMAISFMVIARILLMRATYVAIYRRYNNVAWATAGSQAMGVFCAAKFGILAHEFISDTSAQIDRERPAGVRRILQYGAPADSGTIGNFMQKYAYSVMNARIDRSGMLRFPGYGGCPDGKVQLPSTLSGVRDGTIPLKAWEFKKNPATKRWDWDQRADIEFTPAAVEELPAKIVADYDQVWLLTNKGRHGYKVFTQRNKKPFADNFNYSKWNRIGRMEFLDLYPGPTHVWATDINGGVYHCRQSCTHSFSHIREPAYAVQIAVGPEMNHITRKTDFERVYVWIKDRDGYIWRRDESDTTDTLNVGRIFRNGWQRMDDYWIPPHIKGLLSEANRSWNYFQDVFRFPPIEPR